VIILLKLINEHEILFGLKSESLILYLKDVLEDCKKKIYLNHF